MAYLHYIPEWFFGFNIAFEMIFMLSAALVALYSYKIYKISCEREIRLFGISFGFLSASYFMSSIISLFFISTMEKDFFVISISRILNVSNVIVALSICSMVIGYITLLYTTLKIKRKRIYGLLILMAFTAINFSFNKVFMIYFITSLSLLFINYHYYMEFMKRKNTNVFLVFWGMFFLFVSNVIFLVQTAQISTYVISHITELIGYGFVTASLIRTIQNGKKKK